MTATEIITIPTPDDWHVHLRDDSMLATVTPFTARHFRYALVMPNLVPPITSTADAAAYKERILAAAGTEAASHFRPLMTLYLNEQLLIEDLLAGHDSGAVHAAKFYPAGATTNSEAGSDSLIGLLPVLSIMASAGIPLLVHAESTDPTVDIFDREQVFLEEQLAPVCRELPELRVTVEHLSTAAGVAFVREHHGMAGTITPHHLSCDRSDVLANGLRPDLYCKPVLNSAQDRSALVEAATSGDPAFFMGTDSAPHPRSAKHTSPAKPGIFSAPYAIAVVAEVFAEAGRLDRLATFMSVSGARHYGFEPAASTLQLRPVERPDTRPLPDDTVASSGTAVTIFGVDAAQKWAIGPTDQ